MADLIYHAVFDNGELAALYDGDEVGDERYDFPDVDAVCGAVIPAYQMIRIQVVNAYIPVLALPEGVTRDDPVACLNCAMTLFQRLGSNDHYQADHAVRMMFGTEPQTNS